MLSQCAEFIRAFRFRRSIRSLIAHGMKIGNHVHIMPGVFFDEAYASLITIGDNCRIASGVTILAHDASMYRDLGYAQIGRVDIKENSFIAINAIILPGVTIGPNAIIGAGSVVNRDVPENSVVAGSPARVIATKDAFLNKHQEYFKGAEKYNYDELINNDKYLQAVTAKVSYLVGGESANNLRWLDEERLCVKTIEKAKGAVTNG